MDDCGVRSSSRLTDDHRQGRRRLPKTSFARGAQSRTSCRPAPRPRPRPPRNSRGERHRRRPRRMPGGGVRHRRAASGGRVPDSGRRTLDPEVVLPSRVDATLHRTTTPSNARASPSTTSADPTRSARSGRGRGFDRSHKAVLRQVQAVPDPESEEERTAGPDSALAGLNVTQASVACRPDYSTDSGRGAW